MTEYVPTTEAVENAYAHDPESEYRDPVNYSASVAQYRREFRRWLAQVIREAKREERAAVMSIVQRRHDDLAGCHKDDDCHLLAEGIWLAMDDVKETERGKA